MADVISFSCNFCGTLYRVPFAQAGASVKCKQCGRTVTVPTQSQAISPSMNDTGVEMNAGQQVLRKETSARQAPVSPKKAISGRSPNTRSGRAISVLGAPPVSPAPLAATPRKSGATPLILVGVLLLVVVAGAAGIYAVFSKSGTPEQVTANTVANRPVAAKTISERDLIMREAADVSLAPQNVVDLYRRAQKAKLGSTDLGEIARCLLNRIYDANGGSLSSAQMLALAEEMAPQGLQGEAKKIYLMVSNRESETGKDGQTNHEFLRAQKLLGREKADFPALVTRIVALIDAEQEGARELRDELTSLEKKAPGGWTETPEAVAALAEKIAKLEKSLRELEATNPNLVNERAAFARFRKERGAQRGKWVSVGAAPFLIYVQLREGEIDRPNAEAEARERVEDLRAITQRLGTYFLKHWVEPLGLTRSLPRSAKTPAEREKCPIELLLFRDKQSMRGYGSDIGESFGGDVTQFYSLKVQRVCVAVNDRGTAEWQATELGMAASLCMILFNHYNADPLTRDEDQKTRGIFRSRFLEETLVRAILTPLRSASGYDGGRASMSQRSMDECEFFDPLPGLGGLLGRWRQAFQRDDNGIRSFGGAAFCARDLIEIGSEKEGMERLRQNVIKLPGIDEKLAQSMSGETNYRLISAAYYDALILFLHGFERDGKPVYRDGLLKYIKQDLAGELAKSDALMAFEKALGLDDAKWKNLESEFLESQK